MSTLRRDRLPYLTRVSSFLLPEARNTYYHQSYQPRICTSDYIDVLWNRNELGLRGLLLRSYYIGL
jgi:hypothetical protein